MSSSAYQKLHEFCRHNYLSWAFTLAVFLAATPVMAQLETTRPGSGSSSVAEMRSVGASVQQPSVQEDQKKDDAGSGDEGKKKSGEQGSGTSNDRLFWALPNYLTVESADHLPPLTTKQKYAVTVRTAFDMSEFPWYAFIAGIRQAGNGDPSLGGGAGGYAKRYGLTFVDGTIENFMVSAVTASAFHLDPRYYQLGKGSAWRRAGYSVSRIVVTRSDTGHTRFNFAEILGSAAAAGLFTAYHPAEDRTGRAILTGWESQVGYDTLAIVLKEFWPDIRRKVSHH